MTIIRDAELWRRIIDSRLLDVHTALPCKVTAFDATAQTVDVQPQIKNVIEVLDEDDVVESYPPILSVPVIYPRTGATLLAFPLEVDDIVTVVFNEWSIDRFQEEGTEKHPVDLGRHSFNGAVAFPGGPYPTSAPISETVDGVLLGYDGGALVRINDDGTMELGTTGAAKQAAALAADTKAEIDALRSTVDSLVTAYNAHTHITTATVSAGAPGVLNPTLSTGTPPAVVNDVGSTKVEVEE